MEKIDIQNFNKYYRKNDGNATLARVGHVNAIVEEVNTKITAPENSQNGDVLVYNSTTELWEPGSAGGGGLEGTQYVFVSANGTDVENAAELQAAYDEAVIKSTPVEQEVPISFLTAFDTLLYLTDISDHQYFPVDTTVSVTVNGVNYPNAYVIYSDVTEVIFQEGTVNFDDATTVSVLGIVIPTTTVIVAPGNYTFSSNFVMDTENVNLVSLTGNRDVVFNGQGTISITANDVFVKGINVLTKNFTIATNLAGLRVENCQGGNFSFGGDPTFGSNPIMVSGTFTNCQGGNFSFGGNGTASGTFTNCQGGIFSFGGYGTASGTFTNCQGGDVSFGGDGGTASGTFTNCQGGGGSFGYGGTLSGKLYYCRLTSGTFETVSGSGRTIYCIDGDDNTNNQ